MTLEFFVQLGDFCSNDIIQGFSTIWHDYGNIFVYFSTIWISGKILRILGTSSIIGEILAGIFAQYIGLFSSVSVQHFLEHLGQIGLGLLLFESGSHLSVDTIRQHGPRSLSIALFGDVMSFITCLATLYGFTNVWMPLAACTMIPTSIGIATEILSRYRKLDTKYGQIIISSAFIDDIFGILILCITTGAGGATGDISIYKAIFRVLLCILFIYLSVYASINLNICEYLSRIRSPGKRDQALMACIFSVMSLFWFLSPLTGSTLLGQFCAGVIFSRVDQTRRCWKHQVKRIQRWLVRIFFSASIGFSVPFSNIWDGRAMVIGMAVAASSGLFSKMLTGAIVPKYFAPIGAAMIARGEFSFLMLNAYKKGGLINDQIMIALVWAVLITLLCSPLLLRAAIVHIKTGQNCDPSLKNNAYLIRLEGVPHKSISTDIIDSLDELSMKIVQSNTFQENGILTQHLTVDQRACPIETKEIVEHLSKALGNTDQTIIVERLTNNEW